MKFPNHIILDVSKSTISHSSQYWIYKYLYNFKNDNFIFENLTFQKKLLLKKEKLLLNNLLQNQKKYTLKYSFSNLSIFFSPEKIKLYKKLFSPRVKVKSKLLYSKNKGKHVYDFLSTPQPHFDEKYLKRIIKSFSFKKKNTISKNSLLWTLFDINFLKKEKIYTKLKYSRVPQYDIVSGGVAALFAGFLGFLICEKFGFELLDSGDFYILFMYIVFFCFFSRLFFKLTSDANFSWNMFSFKWLFFFYQNLISLSIKNLKTKLFF